MRLLSILLLTFSLGCVQTPASLPAPAEEPPVAAASNDTFLSPDLDVDEFVQRFEGESREIAVHHDGILASLGVEPGMDVADVGAGTGLFLDPLANAVGKRGRLYEIDISPKFVAHLEDRVEAEGLTQVEVVQCTERSIELPPASVDLAFVCDVYHHFTYPQSSLWSIRRALRPGGRLVVVDFERIPGVSRDWTLEHVRAGKETFRAEIEAAGFVFEDEVHVEGLDENYVLRFRRPR